MKPILFNTEMVRAILDGRKTQTRRVVKDPYYIEDAEVSRVSGLAMHKGINITHGMPYPDSLYSLGDIIYVRETWRLNNPSGDFKYNNRIAELTYKADSHTESMSITPNMEQYLSNKWHPSIHMPKAAARIFLRMTDVRVERLQDITMEDVKREGAVPSCAMCSFNSAQKANGICCEKGIRKMVDCPLENMFPDVGFCALWDSTIKPADLDRYGWAANPWVFVYTFERIEKPGEG